MQFESISNIVAFTKTLTKDKDTADMNIWKEWAFESAKDLGFSDEDMKVCALYPKNSTVCLPKDCQVISEVSLFNSAGVQLAHKFRPGKYRIYSDVRIFPAPIAGQPTNTTTLNSLIPVDVSSDNYNIYLGTNGSEVSTILIRYYGYPVDEVSNEPLIHSEDRLCISYFILYMEALRANDNQSAIAMAEQRFYKEADRARARKKMSSMTPDKMHALQQWWMSIVVPNRINNF